MSGQEPSHGLVPGETGGKEQEPVGTPQVGPGAERLKEEIDVRCHVEVAPQAHVESSPCG